MQLSTVHDHVSNGPESGRRIFVRYAGNSVNLGLFLYIATCTCNTFEYVGYCNE